MSAPGYNPPNNDCPTCDTPSKTYYIGGKTTENDMPDLSIHWTCTCSSNVHWEQGTGKTHTVTWDRMVPQHQYQYDWRCTCDAYKFGRGKPCKHIKLVAASKARCGWNETLDLVDLVDTCPCCGEKTEPVQIEV